MSHSNFKKYSSHFVFKFKSLVSEILNVFLNCNSIPRLQFLTFVFVTCNDLNHIWFSLQWPRQWRTVSHLIKGATLVDRLGFGKWSSEYVLFSLLLFVHEGKVVVINITSACAWMMDLGKQKDKDKTWMLHCTSGSVNTAATQVVAESEYKWANRSLLCSVVKVLPFSVR